MSKTVIYPETPPLGIYPDKLNEHLKPLWCNVRNGIVADQEGVRRSLEQIKAIKKSIRFLQERIVVQHNALNIISEME